VERRFELVRSWFLADEDIGNRLRHLGGARIVAAIAVARTAALGRKITAWADGGSESTAFRGATIGAARTDVGTACAATSIRISSLKSDDVSVTALS
jgi:hypothetical protein